MLIHVAIGKLRGTRPHRHGAEGRNRVFGFDPFLADVGVATIGVAELLRRTGGRGKSVEQRLGGEELDHHTNEVFLTPGRFLIRECRKLIDSRDCHRADQMFQVELVRDQILREGVEKFLASGRVRVANVIDGVDNASAQQVIPDAGGSLAPARRTGCRRR